MNMDRTLRRTAIFALLLIFALMVQVNYLQGTQAEKTQTDSLNRRQYLDVFKRPRGKILAADGTWLAMSALPKGKENYSRFYREDGNTSINEAAAFAPITGHFNGGASGIELAYNSLLDGRSDKITNQRWFDQFIGKPAIGADVETTIEPDAQIEAYRQLAAKNPDLRGAVVVMDIKTGALVVMASYPSYDPNDVAPQTGTKGGELFNRLEGNPDSSGNVDQANRRLKPTLNKVLQESVLPGSTFKSVIAAAAIDDLGLDSNSSVPAPSSYTPPDTNTAIPNSHEGGACGGAGQASMIQTFAQSCNTTYAILGGERLGAEKVIAEAKKFGMDQEIQIEPDLKTVRSRFPNEGPALTAQASIGLGENSATPLHMMLVAAAAANNGTIMKPYLVKQVRAADQSIVESARQEDLPGASGLSEDAADQLADMMREVTTSGTARGLGDLAGKTGTADTPGIPQRQRWFIGFAPKEDPKYAFAVWTEGPGTGGEYAAPIAKAVMTEVLD